MDFALTNNQLSIQSIARDFAQKRIAPVAEANLTSRASSGLRMVRKSVSWA